MSIVRLLLILALLVLAYCVAVATVMYPLMMFAIAALIAVKCRKTVTQLWAHGTARWAELADLERAGMLGGSNGLILGRMAYTPPGIVRSAGNLFKRSVKSEAACEQFIMAVRQFGRPRLDGPMVTLSKAVHTAVFAPTGVGKGVSCIIPFLLSCRDSCVVIDFKGENYKLTADARRAMGQKVIRLDPFGVCGPGGDTFNPLLEINRDDPLNLDDIRDVAAALVIRTGFESEPHWNDSAEVWIAAMIAAAVMLTSEPESRSLQYVRTLLTDPRRMAAAIEMLCESTLCGGMLARLGGQLKNYQNKELNSVLTTTNRHLTFLDTLAIAANTVASSFNLAEAMKGKVTIYLILPPEHMHKQSALLRLWTSSILRAVVKRGLNEADKVHFVLDEAASLGHMQCFADALDKYRGYGVRLQFYYQSMGQLKQCWPDGSDLTFMSNVTPTFFGVNDKETAEHVSTMLGEETIIVDGGGSNVSGEGDGNQIGPRSIPTSWGRSTSWSQVGRRLLRAEEVRTLPPRVAITFAPGLPPIATTLTRYYENTKPSWFKRVYRKLEIISASVTMLALCIGLAWAVTSAANNPHGLSNGSAGQRVKGR